MYILYINILTQKFCWITIPSILGPKSTVNFGGENLEKYEKCLFLKQSNNGFCIFRVFPFPIPPKKSLSLPLLIICVNVGNVSLSIFTAAAEEGDDGLILQLSDSANALATDAGSSTSAQGALAEPAINIARWNNPIQ